MDESVTPKTLNLTILLPLIGEGMSLRAMLKVLTIDMIVPYEVIIVHDGSAATTAMLSELAPKWPQLKVVVNSQGGGTLTAFNAGLAQASGSNVLLVCADSVGPVLGINQMLEMVENGFDFVSGTRYACGGRRLGGNFAGLALSRLANTILHRFGGCAFTDATTGLKLFRKDAVAKLKLETDTKGWVIAFEMALKAQAAGLKLGEVANISIDRLCGGCSTAHLDREFTHYARWFGWAFSRLRACPMTQVPVEPLRLTSH
jgi:glycosyltransferase involved in cell wall biosynthesis